MVWHELGFGVARLPQGQRREGLARYLNALGTSTMPVLPYDREAAEWHARTRAALGADGRTVPFDDGQIAAIAATNGLTLVTRNTADFAHMDVDTVNWFSSRT